MHQGQERTIAISGFTIAALEWGPKGGTPVLAMHGWLDNAASFAFLAPLLENAHVVAIDSPGCGYSSHKAQGTIPSVLEESFIVMQVANALGWDKFVLLAHSRGGIVAQLVTAGCPDRITALILIDSVGLSLNKRPALEVWRQAHSAVLNNKIRPATLYKDLDASVQGRMQAGSIAYESAKALTLRGSVAIEGGYKWTFDRRETMFVVAMPLGEEQITSLLSGITAPTCIILGDKGILASFTDIERQTRLIADHSLHVIPGHHHLHLDGPEPVATIINAFLKTRL